MRIGFYYFGRRAMDESHAGPIGGGDIFIGRLMRGLNEIEGVEAFYADPDQTSGADIVHIYGFGVETAKTALAFKEKSCRVALMPNWWHDPDLDKIRYRPPAQKAVQLVRSSPLLRWNSERRRKRAFAMMASAIRAADAVLAYSKTEIAHFEEKFGLSIPEWGKIGVGLDPLFFNANPAPFLRRSGLKDYILYVARIDDQKNHLNLIRAVRRLSRSVKLAIVGRKPDSKRYRMAFDGLQSLAGDRAIFLDQMPREELASAYAGARAYVHPSLFEIPGLAPLEAAAAGCRLAITSRGCTKEVFGDWSLYCNPMDPNDIRAKIEEALDTPPKPGQAEHFAGAFTWENAARSAAGIYENILSGKTKGRPS